VQCSSNITINGTKYTKDAFVVIGCESLQPVFAKVMLCLLDNQAVGALVVEVCHSEKNNALGLHVISSSSEVNNLTCIRVDMLYDYYPLHAYAISGVRHIALKHAICV